MVSKSKKARKKEIKEKKEQVEQIATMAKEELATDNVINNNEELNTMANKVELTEEQKAQKALESLGKRRLTQAELKSELMDTIGVFQVLAEIEKKGLSMEKTPYQYQLAVQNGWDKLMINNSTNGKGTAFTTQFGSGIQRVKEITRTTKNPNTGEEHTYTIPAHNKPIGKFGNDITQVIKNETTEKDELKKPLTKNQGNLLTGTAFILTVLENAKETQARIDAEKERLNKTLSVEKQKINNLKRRKSSLGSKCHEVSMEIKNATGDKRNKLDVKYAELLTQYQEVCTDLQILTK